MRANLALDGIDVRVGSPQEACFVEVFNRREAIKQLEVFLICSAALEDDNINKSLDKLSALRFPAAKTVITARERRNMRILKALDGATLKLKAHIDPEQKRQMMEQLAMRQHGFVR